MSQSPENVVSLTELEQKLKQGLTDVETVIRILEQTLAARSSYLPTDFATLAKLLYGLMTLLQIYAGRCDSLALSVLSKVASPTSATSDQSGSETPKKSDSSESPSPE